MVGWVGAGGNIGGACFSVLFINFSYEKAFTLMGLSASASAFLSCLMNCKKLTKNAENIGAEGKSQEELAQHRTEAIGLTQNTAITFAHLDQQEA